MSTASPLEPAAPRATSTALEDPRTRQLDPVLARLVLAGRISADAAVRAATTAQEQRHSLAATVTSLGLIASREWAEAVARHYEFELVGPDDMPREPLLADRISPRFLRHTAVLPVRATEDTVWLAMADPGNSYAIKAVGLAVQRRVVPVIAALEDLQKTYARYWDAGQSALHIAERDDHGVDVTVGHQPFKVGLRQHAGSGAHCGPSSHDDGGGHDEKPTIGDDVASAFTQMINQTVTSKGMTPDL